jgi:hypothetical protein
MPLLLVPMSSSVVARQAHHAAGDRRAATVMGFDQIRTTHHFRLFTDGGAIDVAVNESTDTKNRDAIRSHLPRITAMFGSGNFAAPMLVHDSAKVPGVRIMTAKKDAIRYRYVETPDGGRVDVSTSDPEALAAVHAFLKYQIREHATGDPLTIRPR